MTHTATNRFAHGRLDARHVALELYSGVESLAADLPRGYAEGAADGWWNRPRGVGRGRESAGADRGRTTGG